MSKILMLGGDERMQYAADFLKIKKQDIDYFQFVDLKNIDFLNYNIVLLSIPTTKNEKTLFTSASQEINLTDILFSLNKQLLVTGNYKPNYNNYIDICKRKDFMLLNAVPTAEAAISIAIQNSNKTLSDSKILIVGNGSIGKILSNRLKNLCQYVTVTARKSEDFSYLDSFNINYFETNKLKKIINEYDIIFNTVPYPVISKHELKNCKKESLLIELSSAPFGIDKREAQEQQIKYIYAPALPGKIFPKTAGEALGKSILNIINENVIRSDG